MDRRFLLGAAGAALLIPGLLSCMARKATAEDGAPAAGFRAASGDAAFDAWLEGFYSKALAAGWSQSLLDRELAGLAPNPRVVGADRGQPEFSKPTSDYIKGAVSDSRIATGLRKRDELAFASGVEAKFGVPREVLIAIWGMESAFGAVQGDADVIRSLASLAADGRRRDWAETQLFACLKIIQTGEATRAQLKGSWAGAFGQTQFIPETFLRDAVDFDGDGRRDLWASQADALASAANLLSKAGWKRGESWQREVILPPGFDYSLAEGERNAPEWWAMAGVKPADGYGWTSADQASQAQLILPSGASGPAFLVFPNHFIIRRYNNSTAYALGVGLLADRVGGKGPLVTPWPNETGLSRADRTGAQDALNRLGFEAGEADGVIGVNTRKALRAWQKSRGIIADGYLTSELSRRLQTEATGSFAPVPGGLPPIGAAPAPT